MAKDKDKHVEDYLSGKDGLSDLYAQGQVDEPPASVDQTILHAAQAAVSKKSTRTGPFSGSWQIPVALAAVLVLAVGITMTLDKPGRNEVQLLERYTPATSAPPPDAAKKKAPGEPVPLKENVRTGTVTEDTQEDESILLRNKPAPATEPAPASAEDAETKPVQSAPEAAKVFEVPQESSPGSTSPGKPAADGLTEQLPEVVPSEPQAAERWLQSIQALVQQHKMDEARQQLKDFRRVYPDYPLPEALEKLLS